MIRGTTPTFTLKLKDDTPDESVDELTAKAEAYDILVGVTP